MGFLSYLARASVTHPAACVEYLSQRWFNSEIQISPLPSIFHGIFKKNNIKKKQHDSTKTHLHTVGLKGECQIINTACSRCAILKSLSQTRGTHLQHMELQSKLCQ